MAELDNHQKENTVKQAYYMSTKNKIINEQSESNVPK